MKSEIPHIFEVDFHQWAFVGLYICLVLAVAEIYDLFIDIEDADLCVSRAVKASDVSV